MTKWQLALWFRIVTSILIGFGLLYFFFGLKIFSNTAPLIPYDVLLDWESALYAAIMLGWAVTLLLIGRIAFKRNDKELKRVLFIGLVVWLVFEGAASMWLGAWFNAGVDVVVMTLFGVPLLLSR